MRHPLGLRRDQSSLPGDQFEAVGASIVPQKGPDGPFGAQGSPERISKSQQSTIQCACVQKMMVGQVRFEAAGGTKVTSEGPLGAPTKQSEHPANPK